jgi:hypothetical protein
MVVVVVVVVMMIQIFKIPRFKFPMSCIHHHGEETHP